MDNITNEDIQKWAIENLVDKSEAMTITGQSSEAFAQSVKRGNIVPFIQTKANERYTNRLYLRSDLEEYAKNKQS